MNIRLVIIHDGKEPGPPVEQGVEFGLLGKRDKFDFGKRTADGSLRFETFVEVVASGTVWVVKGPDVHGPRDGRFIYLAWRYKDPAAHPWAWRIKLPLGWLGPEHHGETFEVDARDRRPHSTSPLVWTKLFS